MIFDIEASCGSFIGNGCSDNEDNFYFNKKHLPEKNKGLKNPIKFKGNTADSVFFAVFDGMGGGSYGAEAACTASVIFAEEYKKLDELALSGKEFMVTAVQRANEKINEIAAEKQVAIMGTTASAVYFAQDEAVACNIGDSKIFRIRNSQMMQISEDHTDEKIMNAVGVKKKPVLLQYLGIPDTEMELEPFISKGDIEAGDVFIICSDGVTEAVTVNEMYEIIKQNNANDSVKRILAEVDKKDGFDNATVIIAKIGK